MINDFRHVEELFKELNAALTSTINVYVIGGAALLRKGIKPATKDIDLVVATRREFLELQKGLMELHFKSQLPGKEYLHFNISQIFQREDFRIDVFEKE